MIVGILTWVRHMAQAHTTPCTPTGAVGSRWLCRCIGKGQTGLEIEVSGRCGGGGWIDSDKEGETGMKGG